MKAPCAEIAMHQNSLLLFEKVAKPYFRGGMRVLEIGPWGIPSAYQQSVGDDSVHWDTLDICENPELTFSAVPEYEFPVEDNTYAIVLSGQVLEHVPKPWVWIKELSRVCNVNGFVITINPVSWPYHEAPVDCWRAFPAGMAALYEDAGLRVLFSTFESIEGERFSCTIPGTGLDFQSPRRRSLYRRLERFGVPVECAYDTITIGQKTVTGS